jgi:mRNA interferase YafQ
MISTIDWSSAYKRDYRREYKSRGDVLDIVLEDFLVPLIMGIPLTDKYRDHKLTGEWEGFRECHLKPNLLLVYQVVRQNEDNDLLWLVRLGSHAEILGL